MLNVHAADDVPQPLLDPQRLDCYRVAVAFATLAHGLRRAVARWTSCARADSRLGWCPQ